MLEYEAILMYFEVSYNRYYSNSDVYFVLVKWCQQQILLLI